MERHRRVTSTKACPERPDPCCLSDSFRECGLGREWFSFPFFFSWPKTAVLIETFGAQPFPVAKWVPPTPGLLVLVGAILNSNPGQVFWLENSLSRKMRFAFIICDLASPNPMWNFPSQESIPLSQKEKNLVELTLGVSVADPTQCES